MPRMWAQEWRTNGGQQKFSLHRNRDDITIFAVRYNRANEYTDKLNEKGNPYQPTVTIEWYNEICANTAYGKLITWRP